LQVAEAPARSFGFVPPRDSSTWQLEADTRPEDPAAGDAVASPPQKAYPRQVPIRRHGRFADLRIIGQLFNTYIVCEAEGSLVLIDQHAAGERILFEQLSRRQETGRAAAQRLLVPETVDLGFAEAAALKRILEGLQALGLEAEPFGGSSFVIRAVPAPLAERPLQPLLVEIAGQAAELERSDGLEAALERCRAVMACHGAVRAHEMLDERQIKHLLEQLDACQNPSHCPHGRPTWIRWEVGELEKRFKRV